MNNNNAKKTKKILIVLAMIAILSANIGCNLPDNDDSWRYHAGNHFVKTAMNEMPR